MVRHGKVWQARMFLSNKKINIMTNVERAVTCARKRCERQGFIFDQPSRYNLEEDNDYVYLYNDERDLIWKYSIKRKRLLFTT